MCFWLILIPMHRKLGQRFHIKSKFWFCHINCRILKYLNGYLKTTYLIQFAKGFVPYLWTGEQYKVNILLNEVLSGHLSYLASATQVGLKSRYWLIVTDVIKIRTCEKCYDNLFTKNSRLFTKKTQNRIANCLPLDREVRPSPVYIDITIDLCCPPLFIVNMQWTATRDRVLTIFKFGIRISLQRPGGQVTDPSL